MLKKANITPHVLIDTTKPGGVLGKASTKTHLSGLLDKLNALQEKGNLFKSIQFSPDLKDVQTLSSIHFGVPYRETHCFRGYPVHGSIHQFHQNDSDYILHLDCDMIFYEEPGFSWIQEGIRVMEENEDILCVLPRGGPPTKNRSLHQGSTPYKVDEKRGLYLFKNFTSRHYLIHRQRFQFAPINHFGYHGENRSKAGCLEMVKCFAGKQWSNILLRNQICGEPTS